EGERDARELAAGGGLGDLREGQARVRADEEDDLVRAGRSRLALAQLGQELAVAEAEAAELRCDRERERLDGGPPRGTELAGESLDLGPRRRERLRRGLARIEAALERLELRPRLRRARQQLVVARAAEAPPQVG